MKSNRNCGGNYPVYPMPQTMNYQGQMPQPMMMPNQMLQSQTSLEGQLNLMANQINNLERRVTVLETTVTGSSNYNTSNYQMM